MQSNGIVNVCASWRTERALHHVLTNEWMKPFYLVFVIGPKQFHIVCDCVLIHAGYFESFFFLFQSIWHLFWLEICVVFSPLYLACILMRYVSNVCEWMDEWMNEWTQLNLSFEYNSWKWMRSVDTLSILQFDFSWIMRPNSFSSIYYFVFFVLFLIIILLMPVNITVIDARECVALTLPSIVFSLSTLSLSASLPSNDYLCFNACDQSKSAATASNSIKLKSIDQSTSI